MTISHGKAILRHLSGGGTLTPLDALRKFGCFRLAARVFDLREDGHDIHTEIVADRGKRFAEYSLIAKSEK